eukprot:TRINITY_DN17711_c0_g2_i1.p1 TRINITY_DN17711_c0_g2~~TRINITY_DN17711_c0_g2_i1.p1  ORF type:complete len:516 (-),score=80.66 TRINITY_DN17711_c0_g2_i1:580-2127(-)
MAAACSTGSTAAAQGCRLPPWACDVIASWVGCPSACTTLPCVDDCWHAACCRADLHHQMYTCLHSARCLGLPLPPAAPVARNGVTPALFAELWQKAARDLAKFDDRVVSSPGPVKCPSPCCDFQSSNAEALSAHMSECSLAATGVSYAPAEDILAAFRRRRERRAVASYDVNFRSIVPCPEGCEVSHPWEAHPCLVEVIDDKLLLRHQGRVVALRLDCETHIERGWALTCEARRALSRGAWPRLVQWTAAAECFEDKAAEVDCIRSCYISGWAFSQHKQEPDSDLAVSEQLLEDDDISWKKTIVISVTATPPSWKRALAEDLRRQQRAGDFDLLHVFVPALGMDEDFPVVGSRWRATLRGRLEAKRQQLTSKQCSQVEHLLSVPEDAPGLVPLAAWRLEAEYALRDVSLLFLTFKDAAAAAYFAEVLEEAVPKAMASAAQQIESPEVLSGVKRQQSRTSPARAAQRPAEVLGSESLGRASSFGFQPCTCTECCPGGPCHVPVDTSCAHGLTCPSA